ncbi:hypothetical protein [Paraglaciecola sp. T6c]|uniref:hypothetical protein n=1 Tax=Pseudoalteromonas atlantica (strain T6c / ATCC BAA-1087) TaxID=3042615 RepID=UPI0005A2261A|nr:hypothetical protein [Paraglaciecola sp. T6c]
MSNELVPIKRTLFSRYKLLIFWGFIFYITSFLLYFIFRENLEIFALKKEVAIAINDMLNAFLLLSVPFVFGTIAASTRILISELSIKKNYKIIFASGLMASFSWLGIKSKVFVALLTPYIAKSYEVKETSLQEGSGEFYSMALVAVLVGAFASNLYIFVSQKVEVLSSNKRT